MTDPTCPACTEGRLCLRHAAGVIGARIDLDPDEVACPRCGAAPGNVCRDPRGKRAKRLHADRRAAAVEEATGKRPPVGKSPATRADRAKGGRATARKRAERRAVVEQTAEELELEALRLEAEQLAADATRWMHDQRALRRRVLDTAGKAWQRAEEALDKLAEPILDDNGRPTYVYDEGARGTVLARRGAYEPREVQTLMTTAAIALDKVLKLDGVADTTITVTGTSGQAAPTPEALDDEALGGVLDRARDVVRRATEKGSTA